MGGDHTPITGGAAATASRSYTIGMRCLPKKFTSAYLTACIGSGPDRDRKISAERMLLPLRRMSAPGAYHLSWNANGTMSEAVATLRDWLLAAAAVDPEYIELYEDLRPQKKGVAAVELVDGVCLGCHEQLSSVYRDRLKRVEGPKRCEHCRRILVI